MYVCLLSLVLTGVAAFQPPPAVGVVHGRVVDADGLGVPGVEVTLEGSALPAALHTVSRAPDGSFRFEGLPAPAAYVVRTIQLGAFQAARAAVTLDATGAAAVDLHLALGLSESIVVTDSREERLKRETPATIGTVDRATIDAIKPTHPGQLMTQIAGVWVNTTSGEGHATAIRQPLTTNPVYLYLEDGIPTRSTGFFNHNALYEVNVAAAERVEVTKGPGSALYGSDAIGGVINVTSRSALTPASASVEAEAGPWGWRRVVAGGNVSSARQGLRADVNLTRSGGWREATGYDRQSVTLRWDRMTNAGASIKTLAGISRIDQQTAGSSTLREDDYFANPRRNLTPISYRNVSAVRLSLDLAKVSASGRMLWSAVPFFRYNTMALLANWSLTYDPTEYDTRNSSYGVLAKLRRDLPALRTQLVAGVDLDLSPGSRLENIVVPVRTPTANQQTVFSAYTAGPIVYDYDVAFFAASPYVQVDFSPSDRVRASLGVRMDRLRYDYDDQLAAPPTSRHRRPADTTRTYTHVSPKAGVTIGLTERINLFGAYRNAFRAPSEGQLFRQGSTLDTVGLTPVDAHNLEAGLRATVQRVSIEASVYRLDKRNDILTYRDPLDGLTHVVNAGRTLHQGLELDGDLDAGRFLQLSGSYAYARHTYVDWLLDPRQSLRVDYSGRGMEAAPRHLGTATLTVAPQGRTGGSVEVVRLGGYWMDAENTNRYAGHTLVNLRWRSRLGQRVELFGRVLNLFDRRYAESSSYTLQRGRELAPGMPRAAFLGVTLGWKP
jgi:outer membrane receptor protein involved in Fe transport